MFNSLVEAGIVSGIEYQRAPNPAQLLALIRDKVPPFFPEAQWMAQIQRYYEYWAWFQGIALNEKLDKGTPDERDMYPLKINLVRTFARKRAYVLLGESPDGGGPQVKPQVTPRKSVKKLKRDAENSQEDKDLAEVCENILKQVWNQSNAPAIQAENALIQQFLGGCVFGVRWEDTKADEYEIPIFVRSIAPDFFVPVFASDDPWDIQECFIIYRITNREARERYGMTDLPEYGYSVYLQHWTKYFYSIYVNNTPIKGNLGGTETVFLRVPNPFGSVPFIYIPSERTGGPFGHSICEDVVGVTKEYNARLADIGDAISESVHRTIFLRNIYQQIKPIDLPDGKQAISLGNTPPSYDAEPDVVPVDAPVLPQGVVGFPKELLTQAQRDAGVGGVAFGEDEGSQRSAMTLAFRMWPLTSTARMQRSLWDVGLGIIDRMILKMVMVKKPSGIELPKDTLKRIDISQQWCPQIPRDREQEITEIISLRSADAMSIEDALERRGDVRDIEEERERIIAEKRELAKIEAEAAPAPFGGSSTGNNDKNPSITSPDKALKASPPN